jgi:hypothetical protein
VSGVCHGMEDLGTVDRYSVWAFFAVAFRNTLDHAVLGGGGFLGMSLILRPEPPQGSL